VQLGLCPVAVFTKTIHSTSKQHIHLTETAQYIARIFAVQYKYMNIHSTIEVHEHKYNTTTWTLQNTVENKTIKNRRKHRKCKRKQDGYTARKWTRAFKPYSSALHSLSDRDTVVRILSYNPANICNDCKIIILHYILQKYFSFNMNIKTTAIRSFTMWLHVVWEIGTCAKLHGVAFQKITILIFAAVSTEILLQK
jgi:hypothetical protein